ncbi:IclR family transcriptional regulator [Microbacterium sp. NPDC089696]|jgi:DNA-binding IclR family transcriptional regulator|uniref:IclR family transcriptional regulator n=1 Tax=Microbacterium sp. NPDC089696 TaxID=3364199 RepID=UPI0038172A9D
MSQTVSRAIDIVDYVSRANRTIGEIADMLGVHKSTALRLLQTLEERGFVRRGVDGRYGMGFELIALGQLALDQVEARTIAHDALTELANSAGHTVHLAQLMGDTIVYVDKVDGRGSVAMGSRIGLTARTNTAGVAKVIGAFQTPEVQDKLIAGADFRRYTDTTITSADAMREEYQRIVERGWAEDDGEMEEFINCVALPIRDARGRVTHGMSVTALRAVSSLEELREHLPEYRETANRISRDLGWRGAL